jgi:sugar lactone lactonase YvrE
MVSSTTRKTISLAISLLLVVISLTGVAFGAWPVPDVTQQNRYPLGSVGEPGKMVRDAAGNFYVTDFWGKGIIKLNNKGERIGFISTSGRPSAVAVLPDSRLVVAMSKPTPKLAFYSQTTGAEMAAFGAPAQPLYNPTGIAIDPVDQYIYVVDSGDVGAAPETTNFGRVRVYDFTGVYKYVFGTRTPIGTTGTVAVAGSFKMPMGIAFEKVSGNIVVADTMNQRLQFFTKYNGSACTHVKSVGTPAGDGGGQGIAPVDDNGSVVRFTEPADIAFEYDDAGTTLKRIYVTERGRGDIRVINPLNNYSIIRISGSIMQMKYPSGIVFEKTTNATTSGVLYVSNAINATDPANILALGIDGGTVPAQSGTMSMNPVGAVTATPTLLVSGSASTAVTCRVNSGTVVAAGSGSWSASLTLASGMNYILCQSAGGLYAEANTFYGTPTGAPSVAITEPAAGLYTSRSTVTVKGTTSPGSANVQIANSLGGTTTTQSDALGNWSKAVTLSEGSNLLTVTATQDGTAISTAAQVTVVADFTLPDINVSFLSNDAITNNAVQNIDGIVTDANLLTVEVNGEAVPAKAIVSLNETSTYFSTPVILNRGENFVTIKATDRAGLSKTITRGMDGADKKPIMLKPEIPGMTVTLPADNSYRTAAGTVTASGTVAPVFNATNSVNACGTLVTPSNGNWATALMAVTEGFLSCQFTASATDVDTVTEKRTINTGAAYEQIAITSPPADYATKLSPVTISGNVPALAAEPETKPQISINGSSPVALANYNYLTGAFSHQVDLSAQGVNSYKIISTNGTTAVRNIIYDTASPILTVQADTKSMPVMIYGSIEPSAKMSAITASLGVDNVDIPLSVITFTPYDQSSGYVYWSANLSLNGGYVYDKISFTAIDPAGNSKLLPYAQGIPTGDIDGDGVVRLADALAALRHVAGTEIIDPEIPANFPKFFNGDVGGLINGRAARDGVIDITDSVLILNKAYGLLNF